MPTIYGIISRGYFPQELPPAFTSGICGSVLANNLSTLPSEFTNCDKLSKNVTHNQLMRSNLRRRLGIPNPTNFFRLARLIVANWNFLTGIASRSHISITTPRAFRPPDRAIGSNFTFRMRDEQRAHIRSKSRYIFKADINQFYHSIYTHSISWAIHSKHVAKARRHDNALQGNVLDRLIRNSQDGQSIGIPIGPDTSLLIAEIILSASDVLLSTRGIINAFRAVDDYEFGCESLIEAESIRGILQELLSEYELTLNPGKTYITELPVPIEAPWRSVLSTYKFSTSPANQRREIIHYFDQAFTLSREYPKDSILKYAVNRLSGIEVPQVNWVLYKNLLMQCAIVEPSTIKVILNQLVRYRKLGYSLDLSHIGEVLNKVIKGHAPLGHGSEVAWAIWALIVLNVPIDDDTATRASSMNDSIVAILMLDAKAKGLISSSVNFNHFQSYMTTDDLYREQWLLAYEANIKNWLPSITGRDHVNRDKCFSFLKTKGVYFYDDTLSGKVKYKRPVPLAPGEEY